MEVTAKVYSTKKLWVSSGGYNHSIDFSWKTNTLHGHLFPNFFCNSTQSNYIPKKWKQSSNIWTLNSDRIQFHWTLSEPHPHIRQMNSCLPFFSWFFFSSDLRCRQWKKIDLHFQWLSLVSNCSLENNGIINDTYLQTGVKIHFNVTGGLDFVSTTDRIVLCLFIHY